MRSELIPYLWSPGKGRFCRFCAKLGYVQRAMKAPRHAHFPMSAAACSCADTVVFHVSWVREPGFAERSGRDLQGKKKKFVGCWTCFREGGKDAPSPGECALILDSQEALASVTPWSEFAEVYVAGSGDFDEAWARLAKSPLKGRARLLAHYELRGNRAAERQLALLRLKCRFENEGFGLGTPFGHDVIDFRNPGHLQWVFAPEEGRSGSGRDVPKSLFEPWVSVIIPFHERHELVKKVLRSLEKQSLDRSRFEVILVDDGSTRARSERLLENLGMTSGLNFQYHYLPREKMLRSSWVSNRAGPARNLGAHVARGKYLLFLDSDILLPSTYLSELLRLHESHDVVLPRRKYLSLSGSKAARGGEEGFSERDLMSTPWDPFMTQVYEGSWREMEFPWKYFMTYCLSMPRELFRKAGGFRTNYISYGYEDLDLGYRVFQLTSNAHVVPEDVHHLYHFTSDAEYDLSSFKRYFQLAMTSRVFVMQNLPLGRHDLQRMMRFRSWKAHALYAWESVWKPR